MFTTIKHQHTFMANQEVEWFNTDDASLFKEFMTIPSRRRLLEENGWDKTQFTYKFNSHGFRADEFSSEDSIMFLGDSYVLGTGVPNEVTWTYLVSQELKLCNFNLGISGGSNDTSFRLASHYLPQLKPKYVVLFTTFTDRLDIIDTEHVRTLMHSTWNLPNRYKEFYKDWIISEENGQLNLEKNQRAIRQLCQENNINLIEAKNQDYWAIPNQANGPSGNIARDLIHAGPDAHREIANDIIAKIRR